ncbi:MAG: flagellar basal-body rod protein FlgG [Proteobacteria bacterium]|nr:flagellar basal-body rod protein FlgG [Pseudomonadota bacterium]
MMRALNTAATGMAAQQRKIDVVANNMANVNTAGFKKSRAEFQDLIYQTIRAPGGTTGQGNNLPTGVQVGQGTRNTSTHFIFTQGAFQQTDNPLDLAIEGAGFFQVTQPNGQFAYTRAGNFKTDAQGQLVTVDGYPMEPNITIPIDATGISISADGTISVTQPGQNTATEVGQLQLATFANPAGLQAIGRNLMLPSNGSGQPIIASPGQQGLGTVAQGFLEGSNVQIVNEMIDLITGQRAYEINQRVISAADEMLRKATQR